MKVSFALLGFVVGRGFVQAYTGKCEWDMPVLALAALLSFLVEDLLAIRRRKV